MNINNNVDDVQGTIPTPLNVKQMMQLKRFPAQYLIACISEFAEDNADQKFDNNYYMELFEEVCQVMISNYVSPDDLQERLTDIIENLNDDVPQHILMWNNK